MKRLTLAMGATNHDIRMASGMDRAAGGERGAAYGLPVRGGEEGRTG